MTEYSADGLIARLAPGVIDRFQGRGAIDFRVPPGEPGKLNISILFSHGLAPQEALADLKAVAEQAGLLVAGEQVTQHSVSISVPVLRPLNAAVEPRPVVKWVAPAAAIMIADDLREGAYAGLRQLDPRRRAQAMFRLVSAQWSRWRSVLLPTKPLQPAGVK